MDKSNWETSSDNGYGYTNFSSTDTEKEKSKKDVCRDFLNKICVRGSNCKYFHPPDPGSLSSTNQNSRGGYGNGSQNEDFQFCTDFHKRGCYRANCRFVHCSMESMDEYERTGQINDELARAVVAVTGQDEIGGRPLCKEFMNGTCSRGNKCKFWHIIPSIERERRAAIQLTGECSPPPNGLGHYYSNVPEPPMPSERSPYYSPVTYGRTYPSDSKRLKMQSLADYENGYLSDAGLLMTPPQVPVPSSNPHVTSVVYGRQAYIPQPSSITADVSPGLWSLLHSENVELQRTYEMLTKTVADLRATNESLLAENGLLRANLQHVTAATNKEAHHMSSVLAAQSSQSAPPTLTPDQLAAYTAAAAAQQQNMAVVEPTVTITVPTVVYSSLSAFQR